MLSKLRESEEFVLFAEIISTISNLLYSYILIVLLLGAGIYFSIRTRFVQFRMFVESLRVVAQPGNDKNGLSSFQALMVSTASRVGTGNIAGISTAICLGGAGAVFWMWLTAILGSASAFIESTLAQIYKHRAEDGSSYGGPAYYIEAALRSRPLAVVFAVTLVLSNETDRDCALAWKEHLVAKNVSDAPILTQLYEFLTWLNTERRHEGE